MAPGPGWGIQVWVQDIGTVVSDLVFPSGLGCGTHPSEVCLGALTLEMLEEGLS